jgi:serpin B
MLHASGRGNAMRLVLIAAVVVALFNAMSAPFAAEPLSVERVSGAQMRLTAKLVAELGKEPNRQSPNIVVSPASIAGVMTLLDIGADMKMRGAIWDMLGFRPALGHDAQSDLAALRVTITKAPLNQKPEDAKFDLANIVMFDPMSHPFEKAMKEMRATGAEVSVAPFSDVANIKRINAWVKEKTHDLIAGILDEMPQPPGIIAVNALYFKGLWPSPFVKEQTKPQAFHTVSNDVEVPMMHGFGSYNFKREGNFAAIEMPYRGDRYSIVLVTNTAHSLPFKDFSGVTGWLSAADFARKDVNLSLPRFTLEASESLQRPLYAIGLKNGADSATAFEGLTAVPQEISKIVQKTYLKVDEEGTEAAAATGVVTVESARRRDKPETLVLDRPFIFALRDRQTGLVLISGYIGKPVTGPAADLGNAPNQFASNNQPAK